MTGTAQPSRPVLHFSDDELRRMWNEAGGTMIGPRGRHNASISEPRLLAFLHRLVTRVRNASEEFHAG